MPAVAVFHHTCTQIDLTDKHSGKHAVLIVGCYGIIHLRRYLCRRLAFLGHDTEQIHHHRHEQRCRHAFSTYVADTETEPLVAVAQRWRQQEKVVEITAHFLGGCH